MVLVDVPKEIPGGKWRALLTFSQNKIKTPKFCIMMSADLIDKEER